jgi:hypothetical protein
LARLARLRAALSCILGALRQAAGQTAPRCARSQDPKDAVQDMAVIHRRHAGLFGSIEDSSTIFVSKFANCFGYQWVNQLWRFFGGAIATIKTYGA